MLKVQAVLRRGQCVPSVDTWVQASPQVVKAEWAQAWHGGGVVERAVGEPEREGYKSQEPRAYPGLIQGLAAAWCAGPKAVGVGRTPDVRGSEACQRPPGQFVVECGQGPGGLLAQSPCFLQQSTLL